MISQDKALEKAPENSFEGWKILSVDDIPEVHSLLKIAFKDFQFEGRPLNILTASTAAEAQNIFQNDPEIAVAIIDVVMETARAGLDLVRWIRQDLGNFRTRLIIRTGQSEDYPEPELMTEYEIHDYWGKVETSMKRMRTSLVTCLRGWRDFLAMENRTFQMTHWADRFPDLLGVRDWMSLLRLLLLRLRELFPGVSLATFLCRNDGKRWPLVTGTGRFPSEGAPDLLPFVQEEEVALILKAWDHHELQETERALALYFETHGGQGFLFFWEIPLSWGKYERGVSRLILQNFRAALDNLTLIQDLEEKNDELVSVGSPTVLGPFSSVANGLDVLRFLTTGSTAGPGQGEVSLRYSRLSEALSRVIRFVGHQTPADTCDFALLLRSCVEADWEFWAVPVRLRLSEVFSWAILVVDIIGAAELDTPRRSGRSPGILRLSDDPRELRLESPFPVKPLYQTEWKAIAEQLGGAFVVETQQSERSVWKLTLAPRPPQLS